MTIRTALNIIGFISLPITLLAGYLVVSKNIKLRLIGTGLYGISNSLLLCIYFITGAESYLINSIIFGCLTTINFIRIKNQNKK